MEKVARTPTEAMTQGAQVAQQAAANGLDTARRAGEAGAAAFRKAAEDGAQGTRAAVETGVANANRAAEGMFKAAEEAVEFGRGNLEAMAKSSQTYVVGAQEIGRQTYGMVQALAEHALESARALAGVKSVKEAADLQAAYARGAVEKAMAESAKIGEASLRLVEQTSAPIAQRATLAVERMARPIAA